MPYRAPDAVIFDGIDLACLTGHNGAGKSSILDAITWSLWGKARAKRDDELIHIGQADMQVQLDFEQEGIVYRVLRRRTRRGRSSTGTLDLMILRDDDAPLIINEVNTRLTQSKINDILRLDYETFVNSAFLQQGRADAFTIKTPAERKRILSDILGLDQWKVYEERAKTTLSELETAINIIRHDIANIDQEIENEPQYQAELDNATAAHETAIQNLQIVEDQYKQVANSEAALQREQVTRANIESNIQTYTKDIDSINDEIAYQDDKIADYQAIIDQEDTITQGYQQLLTARQSQSAITDQLTKMQELDKQYNQREKALQEEKSALENERRAIVTKIENLQRQIELADSDELEKVKAAVAQLQALEAQREATIQAIQRMKEERSGLNAKKESLVTEGMGMTERLESLGKANGATCPLCGEPLTDAHRNELVAQLTQERDVKRNEYSEYIRRIAEIDEDSKQSQKQVEAWGAQLKNLPRLQQRYGGLEQQAVDAQAASDELTIEQARLDQLDATLNNETYGQELRTQLQDIDAERQRIGYNPESHADIKTQLETYSAFDRQHTNLEMAKVGLPESVKIKANTEARREKLYQVLDEERKKLESLKVYITQLEEMVKQERKLRQELEAFRTEERNLSNRKIRAEQYLQAIAAQREKRTRRQTDLDHALAEQGMYEQLRVAFGKNGVPAMIIETAIPELEAEANNLLARMTDGRMTLRLTTQREKVSGGVTETLDIDIADELGTRGYEMYSGGEAFRINFAIRIALSKMLARRAGAHLRTLFIDEGFGSQDDDGRNKLVEAITAIHIDELRDSFPVHVVVEKTQNGSMVAVR
jgi:exonuclease SbcC